MVAVGMLIGGAPGYISLLMDQHTAITRVDVDREITVQNAAIVQRMDDLKDQMNDLSGQLRELESIERVPAADPKNPGRKSR